MAPTEHGEVYVLDDGGEADLDLGNYERYMDVTLGRDNNSQLDRSRNAYLALISYRLSSHNRQDVFSRH